MRKILTASIFVLSFCIFAFGQDSDCPKIEVTGPSAIVQPGETMTFTVNVGVDDLSKIEYEWSVDKGTIIEGQGTAVITVSADGLNETTITATVKIKNLPQGCSNSSSETGIVEFLCILPIAFDEFGKLSKNDEKARLSALVMEMRERNSDIAYVILYYPLKKGKKSYADRVERIRNFLIKDNKIPSERIVIISGGDAPEERTRIWLFPPRAEPPTP